MYPVLVGPQSAVLVARRADRHENPLRLQGQVVAVMSWVFVIVAFILGMFIGGVLAVTLLVEAANK